MVDRPSRVRLSELVAALSLGIDLGFGQPMEHVLRQCLISLRLADRLGVGDEMRRTVYYTALLINVGCHSDAHEQAKWFGDDFAMKAVKYEHGLRGPRAAASTLKMLGAGNPPLHRVRVGLEFVVSGHKDLGAMLEHHAAMARSLGEQLGLSAEVLEALSAAYEQWDGKGWPAGLKGDQVPLPSRLVQLAEYTEVAFRVGGLDAVIELAQDRSGSQFDPQLVSTLADHAGHIFEDFESASTWNAVIDAEPALGPVLEAGSLNAALTAIANFVDLKSPYMLGHSRAVADLVRGAAVQLGELLMYRRAALLHDLGRLGISNSILDKPGPLGAGEWERVRLSPYLTERMLNGSDWLRSRRWS
jgi:hypothetical protein